MKTWQKIVASAVVVAAAVPLASTLFVSSRQLKVGPAEPLAIDAAASANRLASAIRFRTISRDDSTLVESGEFLRFHDYLDESFPGVHETLSKEVVGGMSLLFTWSGKTTAEPPIVLLAHMDVVPAAAPGDPEWTYPPFEGRIADGFVWGRGTLDMKQSLMAQLEAVELLIEEGFRPRRTVYLAFGHDEEIGGVSGAARISRRLADLGVADATTLDEGSAIVGRILPGVEAPVALIGVAEKGYLTLRLAATSEGGHSSSPRYPTSIGRLARALHRIETNPMPARIVSPVSGLFDYLASEMPFPMRIVVANRWLFGKLLVSRLAATPATNAVIRTTSAPTMIPATGEKENVLPNLASAIVNFRIIPGETTRAVIERVNAVIDDDQVKITQVGDASDPSPVSDVESEQFLLVQRTIQEVFPDVLVAPSLVIGGTDSKHYLPVAKQSFRFIPMRLEADDLPRIHGRDERISIANYREIIQFYVQFLKNSAG